jgi:HSP20 family protein
MLPPRNYAAGEMVVLGGGAQSTYIDGDFGMAEPQATPQAEPARAKGNAAPPGAEPRTFEQGAGELGTRRGSQPADMVAQAAQPMLEGGRQLAEQGRRTSREMADAWRQAAGPLLAMQYDFSQWFDDVFRQTFGFRQAPSAHPLRQFSPAGLFGLPPAELKETETAHLLAIELPGLTKDDVDLSVQGDSLVVCGHKAEASEDASATYRVSERRYGRFERAFPLPPDVERGRIEAQFKDGLLKVTLPKNPAMAEQRAKIEVKG